MTRIEKSRQDNSKDSQETHRIKLKAAEISLQGEGSIDVLPVQRGFVQKQMTENMKLHREIIKSMTQEEPAVEWGPLDYSKEVVYGADTLASRMGRSRDRTLPERALEDRRHKQRFHTLSNSVDLDKQATRLPCDRDEFRIRRGASEDKSKTAHSQLQEYTKVLVSRQLRERKAFLDKERIRHIVKDRLDKDDETNRNRAGESERVEQEEDDAYSLKYGELVSSSTHRITRAAADRIVLDLAKKLVVKGQDAMLMKMELIEPHQARQIVEVAVCDKQDWGELIGRQDPIVMKQAINKVFKILRTRGTPQVESPTQMQSTNRDLGLTQRLEKMLVTDSNRMGLLDREPIRSRGLEESREHSAGVGLGLLGVDRRSRRGDPSKLWMKQLGRPRVS